MSGIHASPSMLYFNPHTREGCDSCTDIRASCLAHFNPHTREGCDPATIDPLHKMDAISIHTPARGVTPSGSPIREIRYQFQSTHPRGV